MGTRGRCLASFMLPRRCYKYRKTGTEMQIQSRADRMGKKGWKSLSKKAKNWKLQNYQKTGKSTNLRRSMELESVKQAMFAEKKPDKDRHGVQSYGKEQGWASYQLPSLVFLRIKNSSRTSQLQAVQTLRSSIFWISLSFFFNFNISWQNICETHTCYLNPFSCKIQKRSLRALNCSNTLLDCLVGVSWMDDSPNSWLAFLDLWFLLFLVYFRFGLIPCYVFVFFWLRSC